MAKLFHYILFFCSLAASIYFLNACANIASPQGGLYDVTPPRVVRSNPSNKSLNVTHDKLEIEFDENIKIEKPSEKVIITPPQINLPVIKALGRRAIVEFKDDLLPNTTYTVDFTDAIVDNNEGNPLENFSVSFSTGSELDTLEVSGIVLNSRDLEPVSGMYVGLHSNLEDTAFTNVPFERISRTDSRGKFTVKGLAKGKYKIYALDDKNRDYMYDNPQEAIAFLDSLIVPSSTPAVRQDTIFKDSVTIDSIKTVNYTRFIPDDIRLRSFESGFQRKYLQKNERPMREKLQIFFSAPTSLPSIELVKTKETQKNWFLIEKNKSNDSLTYWITDSIVYKQDTIQLKVNYLKTDSLNADQLQSDTLRFSFKEPRQTRKERNKNKNEEDDNNYLEMKIIAESNHDVYAPVYFEFEKPVIDFDSSKVKLFLKEDSLSILQPFIFQNDSLNPRRYILKNKWHPGGSYQISIDSATINGLYGLWNRKIEKSFSVKSLDQYGNLLFDITGLPQGKTAYVELLDGQDKPFRKIRVKNHEALIFDINPGTIYARLFIDENNDGEWTTGDFEKKRQPEPVYYYPKALEVRAFTDHEEAWDLTALPFERQKPDAILKNKPEEKKRRDPNQNNTRTTGQGNRIGQSPAAPPTPIGRPGTQFQRQQPGR